MKKSLFAGISVFTVLAVFHLFEETRAANTLPSGFTSIPAASLDQYYPPKADGPVYLFSMHQMATPASGMFSDVLEGDMENARANFEKFKTQYVRVSKMIPEWDHLFPIAPLEEWSAALQTGEHDRIMNAAENVGKVCHGCHVQYMAAVQQKYHWPSFGEITTTDPVSNTNVTFRQLMQMVEADMTGIGNDLEQNQKGNARVHARGLASRFATMKETCKVCHDSERTYYVDDKITTILNELQSVLNQQEIDPGKVGELVQKMGMESCFKCHLVHIPAAYSKFGE